MDKRYKMANIKRDKTIKMLNAKIKLLEKELEHYKMVSYYDVLTKLHNRRILEEADGYDYVIMGDIDYFKNINDLYGHDVGDKVLIEIGKTLQTCAQKDSIICRWGGEEFLVLLKNCDKYEAKVKAKQIRTSILNLKEKFGFDITMSFGISSLKDKELDSAIEEADEAMYESKNLGRDKITMYSYSRHLRVE